MNWPAVLLGCSAKEDCDDSLLVFRIFWLLLNRLMMKPTSENAISFASESSLLLL